MMASVLTCLLMVLMTVPEGLDYSALTLSAAPATGSAVSRALWLILLGGSVTLITLQAGRLPALLRRLNPFLPLLVLLALCSVGWSIDAGLSLRRVLRLLTILLVSLAFALQPVPAGRGPAGNALQFSRVMRSMLAALLVGSLLFGLLMPGLAIHQERSPELLGAWRGLASHKNGLGDLGCIGLLFWLHAGLVRDTSVPCALGGVGSALLCVLLSRSGTAMGMAAVLAILLPTLIFWPRQWRTALPGLLALGMGLVVLYGLAVLDLLPGLRVLLQPLAWFTGKDLTLTGRTQIWALVTAHVLQHPWLGTGYGAYWTAGPQAGTDAWAVYWGMGAFYPASAHNGDLDVLNDLGTVGLLGLLGYLLEHIRQSLALLRRHPGVAALYITMFFQQALGNLTESHWLSVRSVDLVLMTLASTTLARVALDTRTGQRGTRPGHPRPAMAARPGRPYAAPA